MKPDRGKVYNAAWEEKGNVERVLCAFERPEAEAMALDEMGRTGFHTDAATGRAEAVRMNQDVDDVDYDGGLYDPLSRLPYTSMGREP